MKFQKYLSHSLLAIASLFECGIASAESTLCTAITQGMLPYVITTPGIYCVNQKLTTAMTSGAAITINASNVVLDLNANAIGNLLAPMSTQAVGIFADSRQNVTVQNGILRGFWAGVALIDHATPGNASGSAVYGITADQSRAVGIIVAGTGAVVRNSRVVGTNGSTALNPVDSSATNYAVGIYVHGMGAQVIGNEVINTDCTNSCLSGSSATGINLTGAPGAVVWQNRVINGTMPTATNSLAIYVDPASTNLFVDYNYLSNYIDGIYIQGTGKYRNTLTNNVTTPYTGGTAVGTNN